MEANATVINALLKDYNSRPAGFVAGQTITYGVLAPDFLRQKLLWPDPADIAKYPLGASDPKYIDALTKWTEKYGKDFAESTADEMAMVRKAFDAWEKVLNVKFVQVEGDVAQIRIGTGDTSPVIFKPVAGQIDFGF